MITSSAQGAKRREIEKKPKSSSLVELISKITINLKMSFVTFLPWSPDSIPGRGLVWAGQIFFENFDLCHPIYRCFYYVWFPLSLGNVLLIDFRRLRVISDTPCDPTGSSLLATTLRANSIPEKPMEH